MTTRIIRIVALIMVILPTVSVFAACSSSSYATNLVVTNESSAEFYSVEIEVDSENQSFTGQTVSDVDNAPIKKEESVSFHLDEEQDCCFQVKVFDMAGTLITEGEFTKDFTGIASEQIFLYVRDGENNTICITDTEKE